MSVNNLGPQEFLVLSSLISTISAVELTDPPEPASLARVLARVPDPRGRRGRRYPLWEVLAVVAGSRTFTAIAEPRSTDVLE